MLKENWRLIDRIERVGDFLIILICFFLSYYGRGSLLYWNEFLGWDLPFEGRELAPVKDYAIVLVVSVLGYLISLEAMGAYASMRMASKWRLLQVAIISSAMVFVSLAALLFLLKIDLSRSFIGLFCCLVTLLLTGERYVALAVLRFWRKKGMNFRNIIVCGVGEQSVRFAREIARHPELGIRIRAFSDLKNLKVDGRGSHIWEFRQELKKAGVIGVCRMLYGVDAVKRALRDYAIDEIVFTDVVSVMEEVQQVILVCSEQGVRTTIAADLFSIGLIKSGMSYFNDIPLIHFQTPPGDRWELAVKRLFDLVVSVGLLIILAPLMLCIAVAIKLTSPGSVIFKQRRVGLNGKRFDLYKFRSMRSGASEEKSDLMEHNEMRGPAFKLTNDPRVTKVGAFLRRYSLDELPQLWNVFRGEMSLVGPRPPVPEEVHLYERRYRRRFSMRPGITCIWQVSGRNNIVDFEKWVELDLEYIDNWSLGLDFSLLIRTIPAVIAGTGAK